MKKTTETADNLNTDAIPAQPAALEDKLCTFEELLAEAKASPDVTVQEIQPCQSVTVETNGKPAILIVKED